MPSLSRSLRLRCLDGSDGLTGSFCLLGGGPLPPPAPPPENSAITLLRAGPRAFVYYSHENVRDSLDPTTVSRSRVERASPRHSRARGVTGR
ncbi:hypothetical protein WN48_05653 [Eufriesea mexicana]|nr:hypothetical protein WN48_05653 [Eufriesea mexicana]